MHGQGRLLDAGPHDNDDEQDEHEPQQEEPVPQGSPSQLNISKCTK